MKVLIYGIDGGDLEIMKTFEMPFVHKFIEENSNIKLTEDLFNRGWVEILTGKEGKDTRSFYMSPVLDGSHRFSTKFAMKELENDPEVVPLWKLAERKGVKYCIMNVPTTTPVPKTVNGIVIGSLGGGLNKIDGIALVSDKKTRRFLEEKNYIVDIRIPNDDIAETEELFRQLNEMEIIRTDCFIELCKKNNTEFGFLGNRGTTIVQYLSRSTIESYATLKRMRRILESCCEESWLYQLLEDHYKVLDDCTRRLYEELKPEHFIITADHNTVPHKYRASVAPFLLKYGWLQINKIKYVLNKIKTLIMKTGIRSQVAKMAHKVSPPVRDSLQEYDWNKSVAFGSSYIAGIYINDKPRFGGPVDSEAKRKKIITEICHKFNDRPSEEQCGMTAVSYRGLHKDGKFSDSLPDIIFEGSEGIYFDKIGEKVVWPNRNYGSIPKDLAISDVNAPFTGDKGKNPICLISKQTEMFVHESDRRNLTLVYKIADRILAHYFPDHKM